MPLHHSIEFEYTSDTPTVCTKKRLHHVWVGQEHVQDVHVLIFRTGTLLGTVPVHVRVCTFAYMLRNTKHTSINTCTCTCPYVLYRCSGTIEHFLYCSGTCSLIIFVLEHVPALPEHGVTFFFGAYCTCMALTAQILHLQ